MCLGIVDKETKNVTEGWKVFKTIDNKITSIFYDFEFETNKWIEDINYYNIETFYDKRYQTGFHFYINEKDVRNIEKLSKLTNFKVLKIRVRNITATGIQGRYEVGVAREIYIEKEE